MLFFVSRGHKALFKPMAFLYVRIIYRRKGYCTSLYSYSLYLVEMKRGALVLAW